MEATKYLGDIPLKFFQAPYLADECSYCKTRMIHPAVYLHICPNEKCQYSFSIDPASASLKDTIVILKKSKLVKKNRSI